jgi:diguanylate cyclase (GGDEF)-like protein
MIELFQFALNSIDIGIIIIDSTQCIKFWNRYMENISQIRHEDAIGKKLQEVCPTFCKKRYQDILETVIVRNQSRFCSSKLHKAFVFPTSGYDENMRQNMKIEPTTIDGQLHALIQIDDITDEVSNEHKTASLINELKKGYIEVKESEELNRQLAEMDPLTKLSNRHAISQYLDNLFEKKINLPGHALMFLDLDGFKAVNDTYGHLMGDKLLVEVANILKRKIRKDDLVARIGGDEFLILLSSIENIESVEIVGKKLVNEIAKPIIMDGVALSVTASIGIATFNDDVRTTNDFIKIADDAMYQAKREGKNRYVLHQKD